MNIFY